MTAEIKQLLEWSKHPENNVICKDWNILELKLNGLHKQKAEHIHIIADFDMTLTKYWDENGVRTLSSHGVLEHQSINPDTRTALSTLFRKYYPIEVSLTIPHHEKVAAMVQWWEEAHDLIISSGLTKQKLDSIVADTKVIFRPMLKELIELATNLDIPILVFSAGLGDVIHRMLSAKNLWTSDMAIVSNMMKWKDDKLVGFQEPLIHVFNKDEAMVHKTPHAAKVSHRDNIVMFFDQRYC